MAPLEGCNGDDGYAKGTVPSNITNTKIVIEVDWIDASAGTLLTPVHQSFSIQQVVKISQPATIITFSISR